MPDWQRVGQRIARREGVPWALFQAMINQESGWNPRAVSPAGAIGFGQLMPGTAAGLGVNPWRPKQNLRGAAEYLRNQYDAFGNWRLALSAYNSGPGGSERSGKVENFAETRNYVNSIWDAIGGKPGGFGNPMGGGGQQFAKGSFQAFSPGDIAEGNRRAAALSLLGLNPVLSQAVGNKIMSNISPTTYNYKFPIPGSGKGGASDAEMMLALIREAQRRGGTVGENPFVGGYPGSGHKENSFHYQMFPGTFGEGRRLGRAVDINFATNEKAQLLGLFRWLRKTYGDSVYRRADEILIPGRTYFQGGRLSRSTYPEHYNHGHFAF